MSTLNRRDALAGLAGLSASGLTPWASAQPADLVKAAQAEGRIASVGMPDDWANWRATWGPSPSTTKF
ncbi:MAG: hypothetical protein IIA03_10290 [Proteobacteria bacterium]|nr:hypothetical protein [Pseudomonadota bacterium]